MIWVMQTKLKIDLQLVSSVFPVKVNANGPKPGRVLNPGKLKETEQLACMEDVPKERAVSWPLLLKTEQV